MQSLQIIREAEKKLAERFQELEETAYINQVKVVQAFRKHHISDSHFNSSSGYGYGDVGRERLEDIFAEVFKGEDALVRPQIVSGTHAIASCLFALLKPGDSLISLSGRPYDTMANIIGGDAGSRGSLVERGVHYREIALQDNGCPDYEAIARELNPQTAMAFIQRSRGYSLRPALSVEQIDKMAHIARDKCPDAIIMIDNCYGEFVEASEPLEHGADIIAGSLIKNPGGGLAPAGGYIAGRQDLVEAIAYHLTAPGLGKEMGAGLVNKRGFFQGLFLAPHVVLQALKSAVLLAFIFARYGYEVSPRWDEPRADIVQTVLLRDPDQISRFCQLVQKYSPVDSDLNLEYGEMPGYRDKIIMAAGTFIQGSSIELSCDAPLREPYGIYMQGGLSYEHCRFVIQNLIKNLLL